SAYEELLRLIRTLPKEDAVDLFHQIRTRGDIRAILSQVRDSNLLLQLHLVPETRLRYELPYSREMPALLLTSGSPYLYSMVYKATSQPILQSRETTATECQHREFPAEQTSSKYQTQYVKPYYAAVFVEPQLENARPLKWTTVSKDNELMRDLLAAYFTHEYHLFLVFQKEYFLEDIGNTKIVKEAAQCCSALLVNATLAYACCCSTKIPNRFRYWDPKGLSYCFLAEAKRI
ncbi:hypothetical protein DM02DRAFT_688343, partial [Periconia macrospinosa]